MEIGETMAQGAQRETVEEAAAVAADPQLYCIYDIPDIGQIYMLYLAQLHDGQYGVGQESLECGLFAEADIPWQQLAFEAVRRTIRHYLHDRQQYPDPCQYPIHQEQISKDKSIKRY